LIIASVEDKDRLKYARHFYEQVASRKISLATPILANIRAPVGNGTSCFIHTIDDNMESIFDEVHNVARISKNGGGVGTNLSKIRAAGSTVMGRANGSGGVIPWVKILNDTAVAVNQGGKRSGAITVSLDIWHLDILEFLDMQTENGDQRRKAYDVFPQVVIPDLFMKWVERRNEWTLLDPYEVKQVLGYDLAESWGLDFHYNYVDCLDAISDGRLKLFKKVNALDLFKQIMKVQLESGLPYLAFKDTINRANPNKHEGYIPCTNLCVAPETLILTDKGEFPIKSLEGEFVNIWNGFEWSNVLIRKTGENQLLLKVTARLSNSESDSILYCTEYHKWHIKPNEDGLSIVESVLLLKGDKLIPYITPDGTEVNGEIVKVEDHTRFDDTYCFTEPKRHLGIFNGILTGQCTESYSNVKSGEEIHSCNLISINLATVESLAGAMESCEIAVRMLDNTIDITTPPVKEAATHNQKYRTIGVGFMGLADYLAKRKLTYKDIDEIDFLFRNLSFSCLSASADLAIERGAYPAFKGSEWQLGNIEKVIPNSESDLEMWGEWRKLQGRITRTGIRNSHVMAIAPNTSSSLVHGCTASILPVYSRFFYDKASKGSMPIAPPFIKESFWYYQENKTLDQKTVIDAVSTIQGWIDTGISMELVFNLNEGVYGEGAITAKDIFDTIFYAWKKGCKAVYYIRSVQKDSIKDECTSCAN
jgi:ribonucleotide reductase alpha subunit